MKFINVIYLESILLYFLQKLSKLFSLVCRVLNVAAETLHPLNHSGNGPKLSEI